MAERMPWQDPNDPGNRIRPHVKCVGCGKKGCITYWGPWCFGCNVKRMERINAAFESISLPNGKSPEASRG